MRTQAHLSADSGADSYNVTQAQVWKMWTLAHFYLWTQAQIFFADSVAIVFKCTNATQAHVHVFLFSHNF